MAIMTTTQMLTGIKNWVLGKIGLITALIPSQASSSNQLADKAFVNSSISTATATFRGTYNLVTDLDLSISDTHTTIASTLASTVRVADNNDYVFVQVPTSDDTPTQIARIDRYKFAHDAWGYEYSLNNSGYTAAQWAAINSGITSGKVTKLDGLPTGTELTAALNNRYTKSEINSMLEDTPETVVETSTAEQMVDAYEEILLELYQAINDAQNATENAKADYVGNDYYVYHWDALQGAYVKTNLYVKGAAGTTDYNQLQNKPTSLSQFIDNLGNNPAHNHASLVDGGSYNSTTKKIELKHGSTILATIDATEFIKDGMVSNVEISNGYLVITFNTDAGQEPISIPLVDIFDPSNYYNKTQIDILLGGKANVSDISNCDTVVVPSGGTWPF